MCGTHLNRARVIIIAILIPIIIFFCFVDKFLIGLSQDPEISMLARDYVVWTIPGWFCLVMFDSTKRFLQTLHWSIISTTA